MCLSNRRSHVFTNSTSFLMTNKRPRSSIIMSSQYKYIRCRGSNNINTSSSKGPQCKKLKRSRKCIQFSSTVSQRCFIQYGPQEQQGSTPFSSWMKKDEVDKNKTHAKTLSKLHHHMRSKNNTQATDTYADATIGDAIRYEIKGESLRGMEHITDTTIGRKRRRVQEEAIQATMFEQQEQLIQHVLDGYFINNSNRARVEDQVKSRALKMNSSKLANVYGAKAQEALVYAKRVGQEDAKVAAEILAADLQDDFHSSSHASYSSSLVECVSIKRTHTAISTRIRKHTLPVLL